MKKKQLALLALALILSSVCCTFIWAIPEDPGSIVKNASERKPTTNKGSVQTVPTIETNSLSVLKLGTLY